MQDHDIDLRDLEARIRRVEDTQAIAQLRARYCQSVDDGNWDALLDTFTPDGVFVGLSTASGHEEMREFFPSLGNTMSWWHFSSNETVEIDGDTAHGTTWFLQPCVVEGKSQIAAGRYTDDMVRTDEGWKFKQRRAAFFFWTTLEEGWAAARYSIPSARAAGDPQTLERHSTAS